MRIHHLNCVSACPLGGYLMDGLSAAAIRGRLTSHCLLVESSAGLVLVDTGYGLNDVKDPTRLSPFFRFLNAPRLLPEMTAVRQIERMGFAASDVRHIVLTHLDFDHAGGLDDFPDASVHLLAAERDAAVARPTILDRMRYRPRQWGNLDRWRCHSTTGGDSFFGFDSVRPIVELADDVALVPLPGHTLGHAGVAVRGDRGWVLLAGDAYFYYAEMNADRPYCTPGLRAYQLLMDKDREARLGNQRRLRELGRAHGREVTLVCSHDVREFEAVAGRLHDELPPTKVRANTFIEDELARERERRVDEAGRESFPCSDPPSFTAH